MSTLSSANVTDVNLVLKECTHQIKIKYSMHQYSNSYAYFRQLAHCDHLFIVGANTSLFCFSNCYGYFEDSCVSQYFKPAGDLSCFSCTEMSKVK